jgi:hypothetical protein
VRPAAAISGVARQGGDQQPQQDVGEEKHRHYCSLIRGSTSV